MKAITIRTNAKTGKRFALCQDGPIATVEEGTHNLRYVKSNTFGVWAECSNYCARAPGGIAKSWRYVAKGLDREAADKLLNRRAGPA